MNSQPLRVGIGGPVGSGKTALTLALCRALRERYKTLKQQVADKEKLLEQEQRIQDLEAHRARLQPGDACPLCGSHEHPAISQYQALNVSASEQALAQCRSELSELESQGANLRDELTRLAAQIEQVQAQQAQAEAQLQPLDQQWQQQLSEHDIRLQDVAELADLQQQHEHELAALQARHPWLLALRSASCTMGRQPICKSPKCSGSCTRSSTLMSGARCTYRRNGWCACRLRQRGARRV